jgi:hypothetical protein
MITVKDALEKTNRMPVQTQAPSARGFIIRRTGGDIPVARMHYSCHPDRDADAHPEWRQQEPRTYTSQASWDHEQECIDEAGSRELVFADTLLTHRKQNRHHVPRMETGSGLADRSRL